MSNYLSEEGTFINSLIGDGTVFKGELSLNGLLRIDGDFSGTVKTEGKVLIGKTGRAEAVIDAGTIVIGGVLKGNITATEKVIILSTGMLIGNVSTPRFIVEDGVIFDGNCKILQNDNSDRTNSSSDEGKFFKGYAEKLKGLEPVSSWKR